MKWSVQKPDSSNFSQNYVLMVFDRENLFFYFLCNNKSNPIIRAKMTRKIRKIFINLTRENDNSC